MFNPIVAGSDRPMYEIICDDCGQIGVHPSRVGAESRGELHERETGHDFDIEPM